MILLLKSFFQKKKGDDIDVRKIILIEFKTIKSLSADKKSIEELSFSDIEWIKTESDLLDYSTLESIVYIKTKNRSSSIHFSIIEDHEKEFVKELFKAFKVDEKYLTFLYKRQKGKMVFVKRNWNHLKI